jgi:TonB family protein
MKHIVLLLTLYISSTISYGQYKQSHENYKTGNQFFKKNDFKKAIEFYTLSIDNMPFSDVYYSRAMAYLKVGDTCNFCTDISITAFAYRSDKAKKIFEQQCQLKDTIVATADSIFEEFPEYSYTIISGTPCMKDSIYTYYDKSGKEIQSIYEIMPEFPGGDDARNRFLANNIYYPQEATENGIQGVVYLSFFIETDGRVSDIKVIMGPGGGLNEESIRVVKLMPRWKPGKRKGKPVRVEFNMLVYFILQG